MITKQEFVKAQQEAGDMMRKAGLVITQKEIEKMDVADFGLSDLRNEGAQILTFFCTERVAAKVIALFPNQTEPEHWHTSVGEDPGKEETLRIISGTVRIYVPGETDMKEGFIPKGKELCYTVRHEIVMKPGDQLTLQPGTKHWFQAGCEGAVMNTFSSCARDTLDPFTDPEIVRVTKITEV
jgi:D-lyxose ketol-isomerase